LNSLDESADDVLWLS